ncbi:hypothetical protein LguiA_021757 [Lonicera macranthoides]
MSKLLLVVILPSLVEALVMNLGRYDGVDNKGSTPGDLVMCQKKLVQEDLDTLRDNGRLALLLVYH